MDLIAALLAEEEILKNKLEAVRHMLDAYRNAPTNPSKRAVGNSTAEPGSTGEKPAADSESSRMDRFGAYGLSVIKAALTTLPDFSSFPVPTRELVQRLESTGMELRGENKVNSLSALLARSSQVKAHGRRGWTRAEGVEGGSASLQQNEPPTFTSSGSVIAEEGVTAPDTALGHSNTPMTGE
jgi:hypothetical protein